MEEDRGGKHRGKMQKSMRQRGEPIIGGWFTGLVLSVHTGNMFALMEKQKSEEMCQKKKKAFSFKIHAVLQFQSDCSTMTKA